jgi:adenine-specific DNA-methyltransferase
MTENQKKLMNILREMFQFDQADLDFGIYRIMRMRRDEINRFIEEELPAKITEELQKLSQLESAGAIAQIEKRIEDIKASDLSDATKKAAIAEYEEKRKVVSGGFSITSIESDVYNHLTNFFSRYYDDGDFISQRRYKDGVYAIPYEGEEVKLHWANADQYYIKTSEYFKDYSFKTKYGDTIHFKLIEAETEIDNNKPNEKRFFQLHAENSFEVIDDVLYIYIEYKASTHTGKGVQERHVREIIDAFRNVQNQAQYRAFSNIMETMDGKTLLERQLKRYTARNTFDYFIHKDLEKFLNRELDFYIKNDVIFLDDIDEQDDAKTKEYLTKAKVVRKIAQKIISFLAQIEDFQKKLYLKKKFVVETNYCITLDRVPKEMYPEIAKNDAQREEWIRLFAIDEIIGDDLFKVPYTVPLTVEFLEDNPFLVLDTALFGGKFKEQLICQIENLDENLDGLLIHSENSQVLRFLGRRYASAIDCVYGDPPYNSKSSEILYKNSYKHSSWISMMHDRIKLVAKLKAEKGAIITAIDENEGFNLMKLFDSIFPGWIKTSVTVLHNPAGVQGDNFSYSHEYAIFLFENLKHVIGKTEREKKSVEPFRDWGPTGTRNPTGNTFFPILVDLAGENIIGFGDVCDASFHPGAQNIRKESHIEVYPVGDDGDERKWVFARDTVEDIRDDLFVVDNNGIFQIDRIKSKGSYKTVWTDKLYYANVYGSKLVNDIIGAKKFDFPKSIYTVQHCIGAVNSVARNKDSVILDYFAGSGTTGHAVINLNREDNGNRKYILVEMGEYFDTVTKPRIQKVIYSMDIESQKGWKDGKPVSRIGSSHAFKYLRLESYEDTLNNIVLGDRDLTLLGDAQEEYMLTYMLSTEAEGSACLLNIDKLDKPFDYKMNITRNLESIEKSIDLVETFNYLIGLTVIKSHALISHDAEFVTQEYGAISATLKPGKTYRFKAVEGTIPNGEKALVIWREMTGDIEKDNAALDAYFLTFNNVRDFRYIYTNCDNNLANLRENGERWRVILIDEEMKQRMFEDTE